MSEQKKSIRFFNDCIVRAVWDDENAKWWFSATDIVRAINDEPDYVKAGNYWRWLKRKLSKEGIEVVSGSHNFKFEAPDGKMRLADVLDSNITTTNKMISKHHEMDIIKNLSTRLTSVYGNGWSEKTLRHCFRAAETFTEGEIVYAVSRQFTCTHIRTLMSVKDNLAWRQ